MAQFVRPASDIATGLWTTTPLWSKLDDNDDADFVTSADNSSPDNADLGGSSVTDPNSSVGHILRARMKKSASGGHAITGTAELWQGTPGTGTLIASVTTGVDPDHTQFTTFQHSLSAAEADAITDYSDLNFRIIRSGDTGGQPATRRSIECAWVELRVPGTTALDAGFNFRSTAGFVTDGADETHCLGDDDQYPTTRDGFTFGWETSPGDDARDRDSGVDRRLAGINFHANGVAGVHEFRVDLEATSDHEIHMAAGDTAGAQVQTVEILDDVTQIALYDSVSTSTDQYLDATGVLRSEADWPGNEAALSHTFTSTILRVRIGDPDDTDSLSTTIAHLRVVDVSAGGGVTLTVQEASHGHTAEAPSLTQAHSLAVAEASHAHAAEAPTLSVATSLAPQDAAHGHQADSPSLVQANTLAVAEASHAHAADPPSLVQANVLDPADALHSHAAEEPALVQAHVLAVAEALHSHTADGVTLSLSGALDVQDALHALTSESPALTQAHILAPADALHGHAAEALTLTQAHQLVVQAALHGHTAESPELSTAVLLAVADAIHGHTADSLALTQAHVLAVQEALHALTSEVPALTQANTLVVQEALHTLASDLLTLVVVGEISVPAEHIVLARARQTTAEAITRLTTADARPRKTTAEAN